MNDEGIYGYANLPACFVLDTATRKSGNQQDRWLTWRVKEILERARTMCNWHAQALSEESPWNETKLEIPQRGNITGVPTTVPRP